MKLYLRQYSLSARPFQTGRRRPANILVSPFSCIWIPHTAATPPRPLVVGSFLACSGLAPPANRARTNLALQVSRKARRERLERNLQLDSVALSAPSCQFALVAEQRGRLGHGIGVGQQPALASRSSEQDFSRAGWAAAYSLVVEGCRCVPQPVQPSCPQVEPFRQSTASGRCSCMCGRFAAARSLWMRLPTFQWRR